MNKYHSPKEQLDAARSPEASIEELQILAASVYDFVRVAVANNPNATPQVLNSMLPEKINSWNEQDLASSLAKHEKTSPATLSVLAEKLLPVMNNARGNDRGFRAGVSLCCNPNTPSEAVQRILCDPIVATQIRKMVAKETRREDALRILLTDRSEAVRKKAQANLSKLES